jgi:hypothetical protein
VFTLAGAAPDRSMLRERARMRNGFIGAVVLLAIISIPLIATGFQTATESAQATKAEPYVRAWIGDRDLRVADWSIENDVLTIDLAGSDTPAPAQDLATELAGTFGAPVTVTVNYTPTRQEVASGTP